MSKPSVFKQLNSFPVQGSELIPSPRHWNCGLIDYSNRLWMSYRYHRDDRSGRCATAIVELDRKTLIPKNNGQRIPFNESHGDEHHEDARLFKFGGDIYVSWTMMQGYRPGVDYTCVMKYAKLKLAKNKWSVIEEWQPRYGNNTGFSKEKNWVFFEHDKALYCIYATDPEHVVLRIEGDKVVEEIKTPGPIWQWGHVRGGTPPVDLGDGRMMCLFHSSIPTEEPPHFVRYYAAAYTFEKKPPFRILQISEQPVMSGSEEDGHKVDPRYVQGWKPYVVFPCGLVPDGDGWLVSFGVNDWQCAVGRLTMSQLMLGAADGSSFAPRYFKTANGTMPIRYIDAHQKPVFINWEIYKKPGVAVAGAGYLQLSKAREAVEVSEYPGVVEIDSGEYSSAIKLAHALRR